MDRNAQQKPDLQQLIRLAEASRSQLHRDVVQLRRKLDVPARVRSSLKEKPLNWLTGSVGAGFVASFLLRRKNRRPLPVVNASKRKGFLLTLLGLGFTVAQPIAKIWLTNWLKQVLSNPRLAFNPRKPYL
ncbi:MAG: hypothetical protein QM627_12470 [Luteolibacter sp.]